MRKTAVDIVRRLRGAGHEAYIVGGSVRDLLRGERPHDFDVATDARPDEVMRLFKKTIPVGAAFGVVIVRLGGRNYEVATFREESGYEDGRHPEVVRYSTARADARRRDFTINGLFFDPIENRVIDYVGGQKDLERGIIRAIGNPDHRFAEDKLRMLRAVRFSARFEFPIEKKTAAAIREHAPEIKRVSSERVRDELLHILSNDRPDQGIRLADDLGLLEHILPEVHAMKGVEQPPAFHPEGDVFEHTMLMLSMMKKKYKKRPEFSLGVLLHDVGKPGTFRVADRIRFDRHTERGAELTEEILRRLRLPREVIKTVRRLVAEHMRFMNVRDMRKSTLKRFLRQDDFDLHLELHRLDCKASHGDLTNYRFCKRMLKEIGAEKEQLRPPRLVTGRDLIAMGLEPGPRFKEILSEIEDAQLEGKVKDREQALRLARRLADRS